jgi:PAS domain S-box-containing protein
MLVTLVDNAQQPAPPMQLTDGEDLRNTVLNAPIGICILDADTFVAGIVNDKFLEVAGKPYEAIYGKFYWEPFAEARIYYEAALQGVVQTGEAYYANEVELMLIRHGKEENIFVTFVYAPVKDAAGKVKKVAVWVLENTKQVTERQRVEASRAAFQRERDRLKSFFMQAPAGICILDGPELVFEMVNPGYQQLLPGRELIGRPVFGALPELVGTPLQEILLNVYRTGKPYEMNDSLVPVAEYEGGPTHDRYFSFNYQPRRDENDQVDGILAFVFEVTNLINVQHKLSEAREQAEQQKRIYETITSATPDLMYVFGLDYRFTYVNDALLAMWGKTWENAVGNSLLENGYEPWHAEMHEREIDRVKATKQPIRGEVSFPHATLGKRVYDYIFTPVLNEEGEVEAIAGTTRDVTERKQWEMALALSSEELQASNEELSATNEELATSRDELQKIVDQLGESENRTRAIVENAPFPIGVYIGREMRIALANQAIIDIWGKGGDVIGKLYSEVLPELDNQAIFIQLDKVYTTGKAFHARNQRIDLLVDGTMKTYYFNYSFTALTDQEGNIYGVMNTAADVTDMVRARQELEITSNDLAALNEQLASSNEELQTTNDELTALDEKNRRLIEQVEASVTQVRFMLNAIPQQVWTATSDGELNYVNQVVCNDFGYSAEEIVGHGWQLFIHPDDLDDCIGKWTNSLQTGAEYVVEFRLKFKDGTYRWHLARALPFAEDNRIVLWLGTNTNIDLQKVNEERKDEFLSIASHELKTPLTSIKAYNQIIQKISDPNKLKPFLKKSADHIIRLERLISDLLDVTKINAGKMNYVQEPIDFRQFLADSIESIQHTITSHDIILESAPDITYSGDHLRLEQVIHNFLTNAAKYSPEASKILVNSKVDHENIIVSVQDFGIGIQRENLDRLFERYYRVDNTAMRFEGLGLGLFISAEILRKHRGSFWIESEVGKGSTFYFRLPLATAEKLEVTRTDTYYRDKHIMVNYNKTNNRLDVNWTGFQDLESVKKGCLIMWEILAKNNCDRVVNDNTYVLGNWSEATDWVGNTWFPMMEKAGLKYFAHIFSPSTFSQLAAKKSIDIMAGIITTQYFTDKYLAGEWIKAQL